MKSGRLPREEWRVVPEQVWPAIISWIGGNAGRILPAEAASIDRSSYAVSLCRLIVTISILEHLAIPLVGTLGRDFACGGFRLRRATRGAGILAFIPSGSSE